MRRLAVLLSFLFAAPFAFAAEPDEKLADPALEARAERLDHLLRCVVCQSQSIADSNAPLAKDMRLLVRERLSAGASDAATLDYIVERYGDYVLLKPPVQSNTYALWLFPLFALIAGAAGAFIVLRKSPAVTAPPLSPEEEDALNRLMGGRD